MLIVKTKHFVLFPFSPTKHCGEKTICIFPLFKTAKRGTSAVGARITILYLFLLRKIALRVVVALDYNKLVPPKSNAIGPMSQMVVATAPFLSCTTQRIYMCCIYT